jgi:hypothetical protein
MMQLMHYLTRHAPRPVFAKASTGSDLVRRSFSEGGKRGIQYPSVVTGSPTFAGDDGRWMTQL